MDRLKHEPPSCGPANRCASSLERDHPAYRVLERLIQQAREVDAGAVGERRAQLRVVKRLHLKITRKAAKDRPANALTAFRAAGAGSGDHGVVGGYGRGAGRGPGVALRYPGPGHACAELLVEQIAHYRELAERVIDQGIGRKGSGSEVWVISPEAVVPRRRDV